MSVSEDYTVQEVLVNFYADRMVDEVFYGNEEAREDMIKMADSFQSYELLDEVEKFDTSSIETEIALFSEYAEAQRAEYLEGMDNFINEQAQEQLAEASVEFPEHLKDIEYAVSVDHDAALQNASEGFHEGGSAITEEEYQAEKAQYDAKVQSIDTEYEQLKADLLAEYTSENPFAVINGETTDYKNGEPKIVQGIEQRMTKSQFMDNVSKFAVKEGVFKNGFDSVVSQYVGQFGKTMAGQEKCSIGKFNELDPLIFEVKSDSLVRDLEAGKSVGGYSFVQAEQEEAVAKAAEAQEARYEETEFDVLNSKPEEFELQPSSMAKKDVDSTADRCVMSPAFDAPEVPLTPAVIADTESVVEQNLPDAEFSTDLEFNQMKIDLKHGCFIHDNGDEVVAEVKDLEEAARMMAVMAVNKGWSSVNLDCSDGFKQVLEKELSKHNITINDELSQHAVMRPSVQKEDEGMQP